MKAAIPDEVGLSSKRLERIRPVMQRYIDEKKVAGIITAVARHGRLAHFECFGAMDLETGRPMQADALFRIYSMSKPITSVAAMMLYEEGRFQLNDPVSQYIPQFKNMKYVRRSRKKRLELADVEREMTVRDL